ncbi:hypothetical protein GW17_00028835 [Ensete ventricosum]|nr:hypothetical protein GW17_00028835 [Ensete ventricosum]
MTYELPCTQTYSKLTNTGSNCIPSTKDDFVYITGNPSEESFNISRRSAADSSTCGNPSEQFPDTSDIDNILDQLGPRYQDWSGRNPLPVDADLLPGVIPGYAPPFRLLPYKARGTLRDRQMTALRRFARTMPPHFALVMEVLSEKQKLATINQDEEEMARLRASTSIVAHVKSHKGQLVAGTLAETLEAKSRWGNPLGAEERQMLKKDMVLAKHASLVRYLERKLVFVRPPLYLLKVRKAEKALAKVQEFLKPADLPIDLETVSDEERALFRNIGLKMRGALLLVKHIAISLEAESGGVLISLDKTTKGYAIIMYRGKNYQRPPTLRPKNLLTRRQALARSIELQRREVISLHLFTSVLSHRCCTSSDPSLPQSTSVPVFSPSWTSILSSRKVLLPFEEQAGPGSLRQAILNDVGRERASSQWLFLEDLGDLSEFSISSKEFRLIY